MLCVSTIRYSISMNGDVQDIPPQKEDPLSPYLFILCTEGLSALIKQAESNDLLHGTKMCRGAPSLSHLLHLLFADDSFFFFRATIEECINMKHVLQK